VSAAAGVLGVSSARRAVASEGSLALRLAAFAGLAGFAAAHWIGFVAAPPGGRALAVVAVAAGCGAALAATARLRVPAPARVAVRAALVVAALALALLATGVKARLLLPGGWDELGAGIDRGLAGTRGADWPYSGDDPWLRLTVLLGLPALVVPAAALAFWPARRLAPVLRPLALSLLVLLYAVAATERDLGDPVGRGAVLLLLAAAWLWLPHLRRSDAVGAAIALTAAAAIALPIAAGLGDTRGWIAYESWSVFNDRGEGRTTTFDWNHDYGPIAWPRTGATLLQVRSERPHYWKAETLEHFDGLRWRHTATSRAYDPVAELPPDRPRRFEERIGFTVAGLRSQLLVAAGTVHAVYGDVLTAQSGDGTIELVDGRLRRGDSYSVLTYVPEPTPRELRAATEPVPLQFLAYTNVELPRPGESALGPRRDGALPRTERMVGSTRPGADAGADPADRRRIMASPYRDAYILARRLAAGRATTYGVVRAVEDHLRSGYRYDERPTPRPVPLDAFLFRDRRGYCQQFSGAMALLLRLNGIPARVAAGFAPGIEDTTTDEFRVRDMDAHSWVEVYFSGIGWVAFDPTPSASPAAAQEGDDDAAGSAAAGTDGADTGAAASEPRDADLSGAGGSSEGRGRVWIAAAAAALPLAGIALLWGLAVLRARRVRRAGGDPELRELVWALERLGRPLAPGTTLLSLERRLAAGPGPGAAAYVRALRERRFAPAAAARLDRRALRRALARGRGPRTRLRALLVLPPRRARFTQD
jgi:transglutaminase-like putative cysteine protease